jgi:hypothetical protein
MNLAEKVSVRRVVLALLFLSMCAFASEARADVLTFTTSGFTFQAQAGQTIHVTILQASCSGIGIPSGLNCTDAFSYTLRALGPSGQVVAQDHTGDARPGDVELLFVAPQTGTYQIFYGADGSSRGFTFKAQVEISPNVASVPEPATLLLLGTGLGGAAVAGRRLKSKKPPA